MRKYLYTSTRNVVGYVEDGSNESLNESEIDHYISEDAGWSAVSTCKYLVDSIMSQVHQNKKKYPRTDFTTTASAEDHSITACKSRSKKSTDETVEGLD
jgi:hypothetical protein